MCTLPASQKSSSGATGFDCYTSSKIFLCTAKHIEPWWTYKNTPKIVASRDPVTSLSGGGGESGGGGRNVPAPPAKEVGRYLHGANQMKDKEPAKTRVHN
jgi:hypothetical protein